MVGYRYYGIFNVDLEKRSIESGDASIEPDNYYPKYYLADYSIMDPTSNNANINAEITDSANNLYAYNGNIYKYMENNAPPNMATAYFTGLGRERNSTYKISEPYRLPDGIKLYQGNNHRYYLFNSKNMEFFGKSNSITWDDAEAYCESLGGHLATINSEGEFSFLKMDLMTNTFNIFWTNNVFIGGINNNEWVTGEQKLSNLSTPWWKNQSDNFKTNLFICEWE